MTPTDAELANGLRNLAVYMSKHDDGICRLEADCPDVAADRIDTLAAEVVRLRGIMANSRSIQAARQALASQTITEGQSHE